MEPTAEKKGSSQISGESRADFQEEVVGIPETVGHALDDLDAVVDALEHAGMQRVAARADERKKLERLCRYISRPAVSEKRLSLTKNDNVRYQLKTPYRNGSTLMIFEPLDFIARLAALVSKPRVNLTRFFGVFAPNSRHRALETSARRGKGSQATAPDASPKAAGPG